MILTPKTKVLTSEGSMTYDPHRRGWTIIKMKKEMSLIFPTLQEKQTKMKYELKSFLSLKAFEEFSQKIINKEVPVPIILYLRRENEEKLSDFD